jgi:hypothetical protein
LPRSPLRFWIDGEWVEMSPPPEADPVVQADTFELVPSAAAPTQVSLEPPQAPDPPPTVIEAQAISEAAPQPPLPVFQWVSADAQHSSSVPGWPRSLLPEFRGTTAAEPGKLASQFLPLSRDDGAEPA